MTLRHVLFLVAALLLLAAFPVVVHSQITITSQDLLGQIGSRQVVLNDRRSNIPVVVGSPGSSQVWDFRNQIIGDSVFSISEFLRPDQTVSAGTFPTANMVQRITSLGEPGFEVFNFYAIGPDVFINVGDSTKISSAGFDTTFVFFQSDTLAPLPVGFGSTWLTAERDTTGFFPISANISIDTTLNRIDGWGTVRLPLGDFDCLRLRQDVQVINQTILNGMVFSTSVDSFIQYDWIAKDIFLVASAQSRNGDTDPNFTIAQGFGRLDSLRASPGTGVAENSVSPSNFELFQNYPNPFNPATLINYRIAERASVELVVFNLLGERVRVLVNEVRPAGAYEARWDGTNERGELVSGGIYFYRLTAGAFTRLQKMIFLR